MGALSDLGASLPCVGLLNSGPSGPEPKKKKKKWRDQKRGVAARPLRFPAGKKSGKP